MNPTFATMAEYLCIGIEIGLVEPSVARDWADTIIRELAEPLAEIIEVSWSTDVPRLVTSLHAIPGERDSVLAGHWLLNILGKSLSEDEERLEYAIRQSLQICTRTGLDQETYYRFDAIDDELSLARLGQYGTVARCREEFVKILAEYASAPRIETDVDRTQD